MAREMVYKPKLGCHLTYEQAERYGARLDELALDRGGIDAADVVADAKPKESPLHDYFEWDDKTAAQGYRETQAYYLMRNIIKVVKTNGDTAEVRLLHNVVVKDAGRAYVSVEEVLRNEDYHGQIIAQALNQLRSWQRTYREYKALQPVVDAIQTALVQMKVPETVLA